MQSTNKASFSNRLPGWVNKAVWICFVCILRILLRYCSCFISGSSSSSFCFYLDGSHTHPLPTTTPHPFHPHFQAFHAHRPSALVYISWPRTQTHYQLLQDNRTAMMSIGGLAGFLIIALLTLLGADVGGIFF